MVSKLNKFEFLKSCDGEVAYEAVCVANVDGILEDKDDVRSRDYV